MSAPAVATDGIAPSASFVATGSSVPVVSLQPERSERNETPVHKKIRTCILSIRRSMARYSELRTED